MTDVIVVRTKDELQNAIDNNATHIIVRGDLAEKLNQASVIKKLSAPAIAALVAAIAAMPFTGGVSGAMGFAALAALTGTEVIALTAIVFLGVALLMQVSNDFTFSFKAKNEMGEAEMDLKHKNSD